MAKRAPRIVSGPVSPDFIRSWNEMAELIDTLVARIQELERNGAGTGLPLIVSAQAVGDLDAATDEDTPRKGTCLLRPFDGTNFVDGPEMEYWNMATGTLGAIADGANLQLVRLWGKHLFANWESCID